MEGETPFALEVGVEAEQPPPVRNHITEGVICGVVAYAWWGSVLPVYIWMFTKKFAQVSALEIVTHRIIWGLPVLAVMLAIGRRWGAYRAAFRSWETMRYLVATTVLISLNWFAYTYAVGSNRLSEASLGYYINPMVSVALGMIFLHERARPMQWVAIALACAGVAHETILRSGLPWLSLTVAFSFGFYGLLRKKVKADAAVGLAVETTILTPISIALLAYMGTTGAFGGATFLGDGVPWWVSAGVTLSGVMTVVPLVAYTAGARRLRLSTMGFLQYIAPTGQFILAVALFGERFDPRRLITFGLIWAGLAVFSVDSVRAAKQARG